MKVAITATSDAPDARLDPRFGRAGWFIIHDTEDGHDEAIDNGVIRDAVQGAGVQAAELVVGLGAQALITGHCGPKAFRALAAAGVTVYPTDARTVAEALGQLRRGELVPADDADVTGHWGGA
jgi:predicted Fe-Mo cluster-binding NifX family protein